MAHIFKKYEVADEAAADSLIAALPHITDEDGNEVPSHNHTIVKLGNIVKVAGEYDADGNELVAPVLSPLFAIDVLWNGEADADWAAYEVTPSNGGVHTFAGWSY